jgi:transcriptional regulator with XRE-family HTH domain
VDKFSRLPPITEAVYQGPMNKGAVKLRRYIEAHGLTPARFASLINVTQPSVHRYLYGRVPSPTVMLRIKEATANTITPNDWLAPVKDAESKKKSRVPQAQAA